MSSICECNAAPAACGCGEKLPGVSEEAGLFLAIATVPMQFWEEPYSTDKGLKAGTIFPCLDKPFFKKGGDADAARKNRKS